MNDWCCRTDCGQAPSLAPRVSTYRDGAVRAGKLKASLAHLDIDVLVKAVHLIEQLK